MWTSLTGKNLGDFREQLIEAKRDFWGRISRGKEQEMSQKGSKPLRDMAEMTREEIIAAGSSAHNWAFRGVGMLRCAYDIYRIFSERFGLSRETSQPGSNVIPRDITYSHIDCCPQAYMVLAAVAMENLAKGLLLATNTDSRMKNGELPNGFFTHDVAKLLGKGGFVLDEYDSLALANALQAITWQARYPIPKDFARLPAFAQQSPLGLAMCLFGQKVSHPMYFTRLAARILRAYPQHALPEDCMSALDLIQVLERECPPFELPGS